MAKEQRIEMRGAADEVLPDARSRVTLDNDLQFLAYAGDRMSMHRIRVLAVDNVSLAPSPYDLGKGRITVRHLVRRGSSAAPRGTRR
jgi:translation initiation factor IF-1